MKLLAIDTSASACSAALMINDDITLLHEIAPMQQQQRILPMIDELLQNARLTTNDLTALALGCGPGSFTGVRIATSVMQGLAFATGLPLLPVSSLAACAQATYQQRQWKKILVAMDARMGEIYWGAYIANAHGIMELQGEEMVCPPTNIINRDHEDWHGAGNGWQTYETLFPWHPAMIDAEEGGPTAEGVAILANAMFLRQEWVAAAAVAPVYLRNTVAEKGR
jgi:tRNA threonylcarbamoyladenosine biosynthesis protein TsaB